MDLGEDVVHLNLVSFNEVIGRVRGSSLFSTQSCCPDQHFSPIPDTLNPSTAVSELHENIFLRL